MSSIDMKNAITLTQASKTLPGKPSVPTVWRWCRSGLRGVKLDYVRTGRKMYTSAQAVTEFMHKLAAIDAGVEPVEPGDPRSAATAAGDRCSAGGW